MERKKPGSFLGDLASLFENFIAQILKYRHNDLGQTRHAWDAALQY